MKNKILSFLGVFAFVFAAFAVSVNALTLNGVNESIANNTKDAVLTKAFGDNYEEFIENNWHKAGIGNKLDSLMKSHYNGSYPSYYGGMYISDDSLNLIVQIVEKNIPKENSEEYSVYKEIINMDSSIKIEYVKHSYNELSNTNDKIVKYLNSDNANKTALDNFSAAYIDVFNNTVVVELIANNKEKSESFNQLAKVDSEYVKFNQGGPYKTTANLNAGAAISVHGGTCSMGFRTRYNGRNGYVTAGHCFNGLTPSIPTGTIKLRQFANNQNNDFAFVETNSSYTPQNTLAYPGSGITTLAVVTYCPNIISGMAVAKAGMKTGYSAGTIQNPSITVRYKTGPSTYININSLVQASMRVNCGDSGGAVFTPRTDANGGPVPLGVVSGGNPSEDCSIDGTTTYFTNINLLPADLQTGRY